ncbi:calmodulin-binding protein 25-like [Actinidia eriantha]|uniref:calmodulin-binding protein 25-like n=1 Tax=Actinidia eriantha TaxID=165200 RepID=UPI00258CD28F|nr:calmodulin-binding protein 25-like [Actinidia eriantha]
MAIRETKSSTASSPSDSWAAFYHHQPNISGGATTTSTMFTISDATAVATANTTVNPTSDGGDGAAASRRHLSRDGRVSKPTRRRSRASRRTPTTLLNTDAANFRAMVQQFTGGGGFAAPFIRAASNLHFGQPILPNPNQNPVVAPSGSYYNHLQLQQQQHSLHPYQQSPYMLSDLVSAGQGGFDMGTKGLAISTHEPLPSNQNRNSNGSNNSMF